MKLTFDEYSYKDFLSLLYIYSASIDLDLSEDEERIIINKVGVECYDKTLSSFEKMNCGARSGESPRQF